jgi:hypothetical protein
MLTSHISGACGISSPTAAVSRTGAAAGEEAGGDMMNTSALPIRNTLPIIGVVSAAAVFAVAATRYPGGYDWLGQSISSLFQPIALNGSQNASRLPAAVGVLIFCLSMGVVFNGVAKRASTRWHRKTIQIAGVGSMVYAALVVTPMHDALVGVALLFFVTAMVAIFHWLYLERRFGMLAAGIACISLTLSNATMYYGDLLYGFVPVVQKISIFLWVLWLLGLYVSGARTAGRSTPA